MSAVQYSWLAAAAATALFSVVLLLWFRGRITFEERERRRRRQVNLAGRITDGIVTEVHTSQSPTGAVSHLLHYSYDLHGMNYAASQDITALGAHLSRDPRRIAGPVSVKYLPGNPSNSIVVCEEWSGLRD